jgi:hypothetical protein
MPCVWEGETLSASSWEYSVQVTCVHSSWEVYSLTFFVLVSNRASMLVPRFKTWNLVCSALFFKCCTVRDLCPPGILHSITSYFGKGVIYAVAKTGTCPILRTLISQTLVFVDGIHRLCTQLLQNWDSKMCCACDLDLWSVACDSGVASFI